MYDVPNTSHDFHINLMSLQHVTEQTSLFAMGVNEPIFHKFSIYETSKPMEGFVDDVCQILYITLSLFLTLQTSINAGVSNLICISE